MVKTKVFKTEIYSHAHNFAEKSGLIFGDSLDNFRQPEDCDENEALEEIVAAHKEDIVDVTIPVQCLVEDNSRLTLFEGSKSDLVGFYDPNPSEVDEKQLLVRYLYQNLVHQVLIKDDESLKLPKTAHRLRQD